MNHIQRDIHLHPASSVYLKWVITMEHDKISLRKCPLLSLHSLNASSYVRTTLRNSYVLFVEQINRAVRQFRYIQTLFVDS